VTFYDISIECDYQDCTDSVKWASAVKDANCDMTAVINNQTSISITWDTSASSVMDDYSLEEQVKFNAHGWGAKFAPEFDTY
jgi:hypothetical protein